MERLAFKQREFKQAMATDFRPKLLLSELATFLSVQLLALFVGWRLIAFQVAEFGAVQFQPAKESLISFLIAFGIATALILLFITFIKFKMAYSAFYALLIFIGTETVFSVFFPELVAIILAIAAVAIRFLLPNILTHNITFFLALAGISAQLGTLIPVLAIIPILIVLSVYDVIAVFKTKHMVQLFKGMMQQGVVMGIVIPENPADMVRPMQHAVRTKFHEEDKKQFVMLGGGDIAFPAMFAISALAQYGIASAVAILIGSLIGIVAIHLLFTLGKIRALPALPPIAGFAIAGFLISLLL